MDGKHDGAQGRPQPKAQSAYFGTGGTATGLAALFDLVRTERLALRRPTAADGAAMFMVHGDPATNQYNSHGPDSDLATSEETLCQWLRQWEDDGCGYWAVTLPVDGDVIGFGGVRRITWRDQDVLNLYYRFTPLAWGHGYATETARTAVELARAHLPALPVVARVRAVNVPSVRTAERAGLIRRPDLDAGEHLVFALGWADAEIPA
ncbi:MAG: GNAT family N-acetyltransferase [Ktedonobacterales bacterium]